MQGSSQKKQRKKTCLSEADLYGISELMNNGFSFQDAIGIATTKKNESVMAGIKEQLCTGIEGENVIAQYLSAQFLGYFQGFIQYMPLKDTLTAILQITASEREQKEELIKGILYPFLLFLGVNAGVLLFNSYVLPVMMHMMASFQYADAGIQQAQIILNGFSWSVFIGLFVLLLMAVYCLQRKHIVATYHFVQRYFPDGLFVKYASSQFCRFYLECVRRNLATRESFAILKQLDQKPFVKDIAAQLDQSLNQGKEMITAVKETHTESALIRIFKIAIYGSSCVEMLEGYLHMVSRRTVHEIHQFSVLMQCISYAAVAMIIVLVYQVLLMPIQMMQTL